MTGLDQITEALAALIEGVRPRNARPLSGIREAYLLLCGDYEMTGLFHAERVTLANVNSTTMANIVANVLNKVVVNEFQQYPRWWEPIVGERTSTRCRRSSGSPWAASGELPTVAEGAAYTELTWDDARETAAWQKKGGYLGITLEAMDKDDVGRLRTAPRALAQAAWLTLGKCRVAASSRRTAASGRRWRTRAALFHATAVSTPGGHANLRTHRAVIDAWAAAKLAMRKQTELNSGERLGGLTVPALPARAAGPGEHRR